MPRKAKTQEGNEEPVVEPTEESEVETVSDVREESLEKAQFRSFLAKYKEQHPAKYALKEKKLLEHLDSLV